MWEYKYILGWQIYRAIYMETMLNDLGKDNWELCHADADCMIFKRLLSIMLCPECQNKVADGIVIDEEGNYMCHICKQVVNAAHMFKYNER